MYISLNVIAFIVLIFAVIKTFEKNKLAFEWIVIFTLYISSFLILISHNI